MKRFGTLLGCLLLVSLIHAGETGIHGNIQIQSSKSIEGRGNVDQLFGRANLMWAFQEDSSFSSLIHVRAYPAGFGYEPLIGAKFLNDPGAFYTPAIPNRNSPDTLLPVLQIYQAWVKYRFPDFDIRIGRMATPGAESKHFGNYLDLAPGGTFIASRDGIHNALEFATIYGPFNTRAHLGVGDVKGNRGYIRISETFTPNENLSVYLGERANIFDLIHYDVSDEKNVLENTVSIGAGYTASPTLRLSIEAAWTHFKSETFSETDRLPITAGLTWKTDAFWNFFKLPLMCDLTRIEAEYLMDRDLHEGPYKGVEPDVLWNLHFEKRYFKRMHLEGGFFAAPTASSWWNTGIGVRFTSEIN